jgi:D-alanyl-D-alanine carboxypeptidase/D-alanyl-D-alanine-endopeptidase (penicillin-binding protein 4)
MFSLQRQFISLIVPAIALFVLAGCSVGASVTRPTDPLEALRYDIDRLLADSIFTQARASVKVVSLDRNDVLYERDSQLLMRPASNMKLLTSAAAISILGPDYSFKTQVVIDTSFRDGVLYGNIYLKGYGNPDLRTADLQTLLRPLKDRGIREVQGRVCADVAYFDSLYWGFGWNWDDEPFQYAAFISPLSINDNCIRVKVAPAENIGGPLVVATEPSTSFVKVINRGQTVGDSVRAPLRVTRLFLERSNTIVVEGEMLSGANVAERTISVWRPELYAATLFKEALEQDSITIWGESTTQQAPPEAKVMAVHFQRLDSMVINLNKISDNLSAELTLKTLAAERRGIPGSGENGISVVYEFLNSLGIDTLTIRVADASGLSFYNLLTADMLVKLLSRMAKRTDVFPLFYASLPIAGVDGTLANRMKGTPAERNLRAKTGTISGVSCLSGYVTTADGEQLAFSMSMQNFLLPTRLYQRVQDRIGVLLASFSRHRLTPTIVARAGDAQ